MTTNELATIVARARELLREWDGRTAAEDLAEKMVELLRPLASKADQLSVDARRKLLQVEAELERLARPGFTPEDREALDMLMLGLWIRVDNAFTLSTR